MVCVFSVNVYVLHHHDDEEDSQKFNPQIKFSNSVGLNLR